MAKFDFRLKTLLKLYEAARDERRAKLAEAFEAENILNEQTEQINEEIEDLKQQTRLSSKPGDVVVDRLIDSHRYELMLRAKRQEIGQQAKQLLEEIERRRQRLVEADRQVRVFEKLREKKLDEYQQQQYKNEIKQIDEIASRRGNEDGELI